VPLCAVNVVENALLGTANPERKDHEKTNVEFVFRHFGMKK
jgi:hypothetical protein